MAKKIKEQSKVTKKSLLTEIDIKLNDINLLRSALSADPARKQEEIDSYRTKYYELINKG
jgi:hypothetical protein